MSGKCIVPREQELVAGCSWGHPTALLGWLSPGDSRKAKGTQESCVQGGGREPNSGLYCTFRVSLLRRDMEHPPPLAQVGTARHPKAPDFSHTNLHIPSVKENMGLGLLWL